MANRLLPQLDIKTPILTDFIPVGTDTTNKITVQSLLNFVSLSVVVPNTELIFTTGSTMYSSNSPVSAYPGNNTLHNIFIGREAASGSSGISGNSIIGSVFMGPEAGKGAKGVTDSNFIGYQAGYYSSQSYQSNFIGAQSGQNATASNANFIGFSAGSNMNGTAHYSNFIGFQAGYSSSLNTDSSNFIGANAGYQSVNCWASNFIGYEAGKYAKQSQFANFIGYQAGYNAISASHTNFIGTRAGAGSTGGKYSIYIGYQVGSGSILGDNNIIIGTNITLPSGSSNMMNLGGVLFATGLYSTLSTTPSSLPSANGKVGVCVINPQHTLDVSGSLRTTGQFDPNAYNITGIYFPSLLSLDFANDAAAQSGGVAVGQLYKSGSVVRVRTV